jgi:group I intron endonuclease
MIINLINGKFYIGSAITNRINVRFRNHCLHGTGSSILNKAIKKYGLENFAFVILEYYPGLIHKENLKSNHLKLIELETEYINKLNPEYNILQSGFSLIGYKHSKETKEKMKANYSEARKLKIKNLHKNKKLSEETKNLIRQSALLRYMDDSVKKKISESLSKSVILYNLDGTIHSKYTGIRVMARAFKCCNKTINKAIAKNRIFKGIGRIQVCD